MARFTIRLLCLSFIFEIFQNDLNVNLTKKKKKERPISY